MQLLMMPLVFAADLQSGGIHNNKAARLQRFFGKPDRDVAAPTQVFVVLGPVGHLVFGLGELVATAFAVFVGHWMFFELASIGIMPVRGNHGIFLIYSTTQ